MNFKQGLVIGVLLGQLLVGLLLLVHWIGCVWMLMVGNEGAWVPPKDLSKNPTEPDLLWTKTNFYSEKMFMQYVTMFYYAILTLMGNDLCPRTTAQTLVSTLFILIGAVVSAFIFGNMAALMNQMNSKSTVADEQLDLSQNTMRSIRLEDSVQDQVTAFLAEV